MSSATTWMEGALLSCFLLVLLFARQGCAQDTDDDDECLPGEAENCFVDVSANLQCLMSSSSKFTCNDKTATQLCSTIDDALNCTFDIFESSCTPDQGRKTFETWLKGLQAVRTELCSPKQRRTLHDLISNPQCWSVLDFLECMEESAGITKVSDLTRRSMTSEECTKLLVGTATCDARAERRRRTCKGRTQAVNNALTTFFITTPCFNTHLISVEPDGMSAAGGAIVTLVVLAVVVAATTLFLTKKKIITLDTKFKLRKESEPFENGNTY